MFSSTSYVVALPSINAVVGAETGAIPDSSTLLPSEGLWIISNMYSAIFRPPVADGSTLAT